MNAVVVFWGGNAWEGIVEGNVWRYGNYVQDPNFFHSIDYVVICTSKHVQL